MKKSKFIVLLLGISLFKLSFCNIIEIVNKDSESKEPMKIYLGYISSDNQLKKICDILSSTLQSSGQFSVKTKSFNVLKNISQIKKLYDEGCALAVFLTKSQNAIDWRLYDTIDGAMVTGKRLVKFTEDIYVQTYRLADQIWNALTQQKGSFSSKIAYVKRLKNDQASVICVADFDGSNEKIVTKLPGTYVGLYWDANTQNKRLFCSEFTRFNVRIISLTLTGKKKVVLNFKGTCVGVSLSPDNNQVLYCRSGDIWFYKHNPLTKRGIHVNLIKNSGKNIYPILLPNGDIVFCSDAKELRTGYPGVKGPQICYYKSKDKSVKLITTEGYCIAPNYCSLSNKLAYSKKVNGYFQIFEYDFMTNKHKQLTFDKSHKMDACWSPCGNYIVYCIKRGPKSQIALFHLALKSQKYLTKPHECCSSPSWSSNF